MNEDDSKKMFSILGDSINRALRGEFDPQRGGLKLTLNPETGERELFYVKPVPGPKN